MMIAAFAGTDFIMHAYEEAVKMNINSILTETQC